MPAAEHGRSTDSQDGPRLTPYELVFTEGDFESRVFPAIRAEADERGVPSIDPVRFQFLTHAADAIRGVTPEDASAEALDQYRALLFHAYQFWEQGHRLYVVDRALARFLVESTTSADGGAVAGPLSAYVQLPANLFWSSISPQTPPEPVDGFFVTVGADPGDAGQTILNVLIVLGIRRDRAGFSVIHIEGPAAPESPSETENAQAERRDFTNVLPGGEISGLYSILTVREALALVRLILSYIDRNPESMTEIAASEPREGPDEPPVSRLAHSRVHLTSGTDR